MSVTTTTEPDVRDQGSSPRIPGVLLGLLRLALGWLLFWSGIDKLFALGYPTEDGAAVLDGASATEGYLKFGLDPAGPAHDLLSPMAGNPVADALYLAGTLGAGTALLLGVVTRIAATGAVTLMVMLWFSALPGDYNPFLDQHLVYALIGLVVVFSPAGDYLGLGRWWRSVPLVRNSAWLI